MQLYIHIPFCDSKCGYCAFNSFDDKLHYKKQYLNALELDLRNSIESSLPKKTYLESIYIGGGTPNVLKPKDYENIFQYLQKYINENTEITMELNPNRGNIEYLNDFANLGVNRFSIGVQSFLDSKLELLQRIHDKELAKKFIRNAIDGMVKNISIDLIYDTNLDSIDTLKEELNIASNLGVGHISCYSLSIDSNSKFQKQNINPTCENSLCYELKEILEKLGFLQYEVSNFAKTHKSKHNLGYWEYKEYIGIGLSAVGRVKNQRIYKENDLGKYIKNPMHCENEYLTNEDMNLEKIFLGLRCECGVDIEIIKNKNNLKEILKAKYVEENNGRIYNKNYFLSDELALFLS